MITDLELVQCYFFDLFIRKFQGKMSNMSMYIFVEYGLACVVPLLYELQLKKMGIQDLQSGPTLKPACAATEEG